VETVEYKSQKLIVDDEVIALNDDFRIIEPVWWSVSIYDGEEKYNEDLEQFTIPQRYVLWLQSSVGVIIVTKQTKTCATSTNWQHVIC